MTVAFAIAVGAAYYATVGPVRQMARPLGRDVRESVV